MLETPKFNQNGQKYPDIETHVDSAFTNARIFSSWLKHKVTMLPNA
jgi:hypothetical protein